MGSVPEFEKSLNESLPGAAETLLAQQRRDEPQDRQTAGGEDQGRMHGGLQETKTGPRIGGLVSCKNIFNIYRISVTRLFRIFSIYLARECSTKGLTLST